MIPKFTLFTRIAVFVEKFEYRCLLRTGTASYFRMCHSIQQVRIFILRVFEWVQMNLNSKLYLVWSFSLYF